MDWSTAQTLTFEPLDDTAFPAVQLAREAGRRGSSAPATYNAANEEAVSAFLAGRLPFVRIVDVVEAVVTELPLRELRTPADVLMVEGEARERARTLISRTSIEQEDGCLP
jgi:1-deoxy-D-xylulose-5-phosphate reductoisomerase